MFAAYWLYCQSPIFIRLTTSVTISFCLCDKTQGLPELDVRIKWPNDLYLKGLKVGGILCTSSYEPKVYNICTGKTCISNFADSKHLISFFFLWQGWDSFGLNQVLV